MLDSTKATAAVSAATAATALHTYRTRIHAVITVQVYSIATNSWTVRPPMPHIDGGHGHAPFASGEFFVMGGEAQENGRDVYMAHDYLMIYNPVSDSWRAYFTHSLFPPPEVTLPFSIQCYRPQSYSLLQMFHLLPPAHAECGAHMLTHTTFPTFTPPIPLPPSQS